MAFKLAWAICQQASGAKRVSPRMKDFLLQAVGLAALGTVADVVPLVDENRVLVRHGLVSLAHMPDARPGHAHEDRQGRAETARDGKLRLDSEDIAFTLAPRLNAAGRLGQPQLAVELLVTDRPDRPRSWPSTSISSTPRGRRWSGASTWRPRKQIKEQFDPEDDAALVLAERGWHPGVIGIVAGRLADKYPSPGGADLLGPAGVQPGIGSARSVPGFNLHAALAACDEYLLSHGGHAAAAGLKIEEGQLDGFRGAFCESRRARS